MCRFVLCTHGEWIKLTEVELKSAGYTFLYDLQSFLYHVLVFSRVKPKKEALACSA